MNLRKEEAGYLMSLGIIEKNILKEINNKEVALLDNSDLVSHLSESEKVNTNYTKFKTQSKTIKKRFDELSVLYTDLSIKVANL